MEITRFLPNIFDLVGHQAIMFSQMLPNTLLVNFIIMYLQTFMEKHTNPKPWCNSMTTNVE
jgi:hypothetical protein